MKKLLPSGNLMLASANRVKALILEEMALDVYNSIVSDGKFTSNIQTLKKILVWKIEHEILIDFSGRRNVEKS